MEIEGSYTLQATPDEVWHALTDWQVWARDVFGIEQAEQVDAGSYRLTLRIHQAPLAGVYTQLVTVTEHHAPYYCRITIAGDQGQLDAFDGYGVFHLNQQEQHTIVAYKGYIISGITDEKGAPVAPLVVKGAVMLLLQQFLTRLSERVLERYEQQSTSSNGSTIRPFRQDEPFIVHEERITIPAPPALRLPSSRQERRWNQRNEWNEQQDGHDTTQGNAGNTSNVGPSWLRWLIHLSGLGHGNPNEEVRWTQRIRRFSIASVLLFLVWVGTRIPRK